jgi:hypothetical protein
VVTETQEARMLIFLLSRTVGDTPRWRMAQCMEDWEACTR